MPAYIWYFCGVRLETLLSYYRRMLDCGSSDDERIGYWGASQRSLLANERLEVLDLENSSDELKLLVGGCREYLLLIVRPILNAVSVVMTLEFVVYLAG